MKKSCLFITLLLCLLLLISCSNNRNYRRSVFFMGTITEFNIPVEGKTIAEIKKICDIAESRISELEGLLSKFKESSSVSKINNDSTKSTVKVPSELFELMKRAKGYHTLTEGAFDVTVAPLMELWGFVTPKENPPTSQKISERLPYVGSDKIELDEKENTLTFRDPRVKIDFGGLAKGYAVDEVVKLFKKNNLTSGIINIGGDLYCLGMDSDNQPWSIGIKDPKWKNEVLAILNVSNKAIATSGDYENFYIRNNKRYAHIIDPKSGYTVSSNMRGVTIVTEDCTTADALATAVFVLGETEGIKLIENLPNVDCLIIVEQGNILNMRMSTGMSKYLSK